MHKLNKHSENSAIADKLKKVGSKEFLKTEANQVDERDLKY